jgi:hypothetical protein
MAASIVITPSAVKIVFSPVIELPPPVSAPPRGATRVDAGLAVAERARTGVEVRMAGALVAVAVAVDEPAGPLVRVAVGASPGAPVPLGELAAPPVGLGRVVALGLLGDAVRAPGPGDDDCDPAPGARSSAWLSPVVLAQKASNTSVITTIAPTTVHRIACRRR